MVAIEAVLERYWPPFAELLADRRYWDDLSQITVVRLLLEKIGETPVKRSPDGMMTEAAYAELPKSVIPALAGFAATLIAPDEDERKN